MEARGKRTLATKGSGRKLGGEMSDIADFARYKRQREVDEAIAQPQRDSDRLSAWWAYIKYGLCDKPDPPEAA